MADDSDDQKTEDPSQKKLDDAHDKGQFASSREVNHLFMLLGGTILVVMLAPSMMVRIARVMVQFLDHPDQLADAGRFGELIASTASVVGGALAAPFAILVVLALLSGLMQITAAFGQVQAGLTWFVDNFPRIAEWRSHVERLLEFERALDSTTEATNESGETTAITLVLASDELGKEVEEVLTFRDLQIAHADGSIVLGETNTKIAKGERVLIAGDSGSGKSTLFRAIAGLWPWGAGSIVHPNRDDMMFMPQRSYLPIGTLRAAIAYPSPTRKFTKAAVAAALERCGLEHLIERMNETEKWDRVLSVGEQQRVAFARLLLHKPGWVFMDEATSALDERGQVSMMNLFSEELAGSTLVSIAHRTGLDVFHDRTLNMVISATGTKLVTKRRRSDKKSDSSKRAK